jgi:hypothetical protein
MNSSRKFRALLYRTPSVAVCLLLAFSIVAFQVLSAPANAQSKKQVGPRAISVVGWNDETPAPKPFTSVLIPIAILDNGRYYDANLYQAQPAPLAVDTGVIYDVLAHGEPIGTFSVGRAEQKNGEWYGTGVFDPKGADTPKRAKSSAGSQMPKPKSSDDDTRPKLRRGPPPAATPKLEDNPELSKIDRDPNRPKLKRGAPQPEKGPPKNTDWESAIQSPKMHILPAVSDSSGPEPHSFGFHYSAGEEEKLRAAMEKLARAELAKNAGTHSPAAAAARGRTPSRQTRTTPVAPSVEFSEPHFAAYDVNSNNAPVVVYSATAMVNGAKKYITVAAWEEIDQSLRRVFGNITDDAHLDVYPRLELVDAFDANGKGRGELLFRAYSDRGSRFVLYHAGPDSLELLFDSARGESGG